jgi:hypothetical protein
LHFLSSPFTTLWLSLQYLFVENCNLWLLASVVLWSNTSKY